jgi:bacteriocin-like protein
MKKANKPGKEQKSQGRVPKQHRRVTELTDQELEQVQGGVDWSGPGDEAKKARQGPLAVDAF